MASSSFCFTASRFTVGAKLAAAKRTSKSRRQSGVVTTKAAFVSSGVTTSDLKANGGRSVVELNGTKILIQVSASATTANYPALLSPTTNARARDD